MGATVAADKNGHMNLGAQTELTLTQLDKLSGDVLEATGKRNSGVATANLAVLEAYNIM